MNDNRLTHEESQGTFKDILERFSGHRGRLWHRAIKRFLVGTSTDFYMLEIGKSGSIRNLLETFSHAGFSISPVSGMADEALRRSKPEGRSGERECFRMLPVRAMDFVSTNGVDHKTMASRVQHIGHMAGCVSTSWDAACTLLLETVEERHEFDRRKRFLELSPSPIVWTFVAGNNGNRTGFGSGAEGEVPQLVGLVSRDAGLGFQGIAEADYLYNRLGRIRGTIIPSDIFAFSINTDKI